MLIECMNFFINEFLWMLSWGWYQLAFSIPYMWILCITFGTIKIIPSFIITIASYAWAILFYFIVIGNLCIYYAHDNSLANSIPAYSPLYAALFLALIYTALQVIFFIVMRNWYFYSTKTLGIFALISNIIASLSASYCINIIF